jgi:hypothetical protein
MKLRSAILLSAVLCLLEWGGAADAAEKIKLAVLGFESMTSRVSARQADFIEDMFASELAGSRTISVLERQQLDKLGVEIQRNSSGLFDNLAAVEAGKLAGAPYVLVGSVVELYNSASQATATLRVRVIETGTSEVRLSLSETASESDPGGNAGGGGDLSRGESRAISYAVSALCHAIRANLGDEIHRVVSVDGQNFVIDIGATTGVKEETLYLVSAEGDTIAGDAGRPRERIKLPLAVLRVRQVQNNISICTPYSGYTDQIHVGDRVEPISPIKARGVYLVGRTPGSPAQPAPIPTQAPILTPAPTLTPALTPDPYQAPELTPTPTPVQTPDNKSAPAVRNPSDNPLFGIWKAVDGKSNYTNAPIWAEPLPLKSGEMRIMGSSKVMIEWRLRFESPDGKGWSNYPGVHEEKPSSFQGNPPKKISWKENVKYTSANIPSFTLVRYSIEFKRDNTLLFRIYDKYRSSFATFKLDK